ncbi:MAG: nuclear transport factor 2 family protein [Proteobacteria bacterium]|nr:nuclear transport factor 2 family protein [Pseudomonadota bacterium]
MNLEAIEAIKQLKYKYMRCLDTKRWDEIAECFTPDAEAAYSGGKYSFEGRDAIVQFLRDAMGSDSFLSSHQVHHPEIRFTSDTEATGTWALQDVVIDQRFEITIRGAAFYEDEYVCVDGEWKIRRTGYTRLYEELQSRKDVPGLKLTASLWTTGGRSEL